MREARKNLILVFASLLLVGFGCAAVAPPLELPTEPPDTRSTQPASDVPEASIPAPTMPDAAADTSTQKPYYIAYTADGLAEAKRDGRPVLLYFWAGWCPICRAEEPKLKLQVEGSGLPVAGFRVDYDTQEELKKEFRVAYQHTTVILDGMGNESARFTGPASETELLAALRVAAGK
jgi:thioredoxin 1